MYYIVKVSVQVDSEQKPQLFTFLVEDAVSVTDAEVQTVRYLEQEGYSDFEVKSVVKQNLSGIISNQQDFNA